MTERDAFLQAILEKPDDDAPRLIFADWLEEYGEPERADLIRVQCELALLQKKKNDPLLRKAAASLQFDTYLANLELGRIGKQIKQLQEREGELLRQFGNNDWWVDDLSIPAKFSTSDASIWGAPALQRNS